METVEQIKTKLRELYLTAPNIHMDVNLTRPRLQLSDAEAKIIGVFRNIFQIEEHSMGVARRHDLQYTEILIGRIVIKELKP